MRAAHQAAQISLVQAIRPKRKAGGVPGAGQAAAIIAFELRQRLVSTPLHCCLCQAARAGRLQVHLAWLTSCNEPCSGRLRRLRSLAPVIGNLESESERLGSGGLVLCVCLTQSLDELCQS
jgi:hypothetical protein